MRTANKRTNPTAVTFCFMFRSSLDSPLLVLHADTRSERRTALADDVIISGYFVGVHRVDTCLLTRADGISVARIRSLVVATKTRCVVSVFFKLCPRRSIAAGAGGVVVWVDPVGGQRNTGHAIT